LIVSEGKLKNSMNRISSLRDFCGLLELVTSS